MKALNNMAGSLSYKTNRLACIGFSGLGAWTPRPLPMHDYDGVVASLLATHKVPLS